MAGYDGSGDPMEHLMEFDQMSLLHRLSDYVKCRVLVTTFKGAARKWFSTLPPDSIINYDNFMRFFTTQFASSIQAQRNTISLFTIKQGKGESLKMFVQRFNKEVLEVPSVSDEIKAVAFAQGLQEEPIFSVLALDPETDYKRLQRKAGQYIQLEEALTAKRGTVIEVSGKNATRKIAEEGKEKGRIREIAAPKMKREEGNPRPWALYDDYNELKEALEVVLNKIKRREGFQWPRTRAERPQKPRGPSFYDIHNDYGHKKEKCGHLKDEAERMARDGKINNLLVHLPPRNLGQPPNREERRGGIRRNEGEEGEPQGQVVKVINVIMEGPTDGDTHSTRRAHARACLESEVMSIDRVSGPAITFVPEDKVGIRTPHNDALVITALIAHHQISRVLVDGGSSVDIIFMGAFKQMDLGTIRLELVNTSLYGFGGENVEPIGQIQLQLCLGRGKHMKTRHIKFFIVDAPSSYNMILGRPAIGVFRSYRVPISSKN